MSNPKPPSSLGKNPHVSAAILSASKLLYGIECDVSDTTIRVNQREIPIDVHPLLIWNQIVDIADGAELPAYTKGVCLVTMAAFLDSRCLTGKFSLEATDHTLLNAYDNWAVEEGYPRLASPAVTSALLELGYRYIEVPNTVKTKRSKTWLGIEVIGGKKTSLRNRKVSRSQN